MILRSSIVKYDFNTTTEVYKRFLSKKQTEAHTGGADSARRKSILETEYRKTMTRSRVLPQLFFS